MLRKTKITIWQVLATVVIASILCALLLFWKTYQTASRLRISFFDVGQGDAALIQTPYGQNILIDGGSDQRVIAGLEKALPWWDRTLDMMVLTHPHDDHVSGLIPVLKKYHIKLILHTGVASDAPAYQEWLKIAKASAVPLVISDKAQRIGFGPDCFLEIKYPLVSLVGLAMENLNNASIVSELVCEDKKILFTGDAETEVETALLESGKLDDVDILKAGHHGSDTSSSREFLEAIRPEKAVISVGKDNDYGHPSLRIIKRFERIGAVVLRTDIAGNIFE